MTFLARQLVDTQYLSRIAREYLSRLYPEEKQTGGKNSRLGHPRAAHRNAAPGCGG